MAIHEDRHRLSQAEILKVLRRDFELTELVTVYLSDVGELHNTKILVDSLNEKHLNKLIPLAQKDDLKGSIARLEAALSSCGIRDATDHISFLRKLQQLRSSATAHRKGTEYRKVAEHLGIEDQSLRAISAEILRLAVALLDYLTGVVRSNRMRLS